MKEMLVLWERMAASRAAVRALKRAGALRGEAAERAEALFPDAVPAAGPLGRALAALFVSGAVAMLVAFAAMVTHSHSLTGIALFSAAVLALATEAFLAMPRFTLSGAAGTTAFWCWIAVMAATAGIVEGGDRAIPFVLLAGALCGAAAAWRWGVPLLALLGAGALFGFLARVPLGRVAWIVVALLAAPLLERALDRPEAPSHREALAFALAAALVALYLAGNAWSVATRFVEHGLGERPLPAGPGPGWMPLAWLATFAVPLAVVAWGVARRRPWMLALGALLLAASFVTLRHFVHLAPLWEILVLSGAAVGGIGLALIRFLGARGAWRGFTDEPLLSRPERAEALGAVALVAAHLPQHAPAAPRQDDGARFASGGGDAGGGGASDQY